MRNLADFLITVVLIIVLGFILGAMIGYNDGKKIAREELIRDVIAAHAGHYDIVTGKFEWNAVTNSDFTTNVNLLKIVK